MADVFLAKIIGATLLSIALIISAVKKNSTVSVAIIIIGIAFFLLMSN